MPVPPRPIPPSMTLERHFPKAIDSLDNVFTFLHDGLAPVTTNGHVREVLTFGTEEFFTNCVKYNRKSKNNLLVRIIADADTVSVQIIDNDVEPFDVTRAPQPDLNAGLESRRPGGLGIHISHQLLDNLSYEYAGNSSIITMTMNLRD